MITRLSHTTVYVLDQDEAKAFYTEKLGFEVRDDVRMDDFRWLTVGPKDQPDLRIVLMPIGGGPTTDEQDAKHLRALVAKGALGAGVMRTDDCQATYKELSARGVDFVQEPAERPYGVEAVFRDNSGNWFSLTQPRG
jgi:catechol 2,3-dioxygenase-like lactoylglutathione lyase family enzyme